MKKEIILLSSALAVLTPSLISENKNSNLKIISQQETQLDSLSSFLKENGFFIDSLFLDNRFEIYTQIDKYYKNSLEYKSRKAINSLPKEQQQAEFDKRCENYKKEHKYFNKKIGIKFFIEDYKRDLEEAEKRFGIEKEIIASILAIESNFGKNSGKYNPFNAYVSLYLTGHRRDFASEQLLELLKYCNKKNKDIFELRSSYAGAMGYAQFIPSNINKLFLGEDLYSMRDNIISIGNFISYHQKQTGSLEKAVLRYNPSEVYQRFILDLAKELKK